LKTKAAKDVENENPLQTGPVFRVMFAFISEGLTSFRQGAFFLDLLLKDLSHVMKTSG
jgi:hypothetical protein